MGKNIFNEKDMNELQKNPYVEKVSQNSITYTKEFRELFVREHKNGKLPTQILKDAGFDTVVLGRERIRNMRRRFRSMEIRQEGFDDTRKGNLGRPVTKDLSSEEEIKRLKNKIRYLEQENEFLKKINFLELQAQQKPNLKKSSKSFVR